MYVFGIVECRHWTIILLQFSKWQIEFSESKQMGISVAVASSHRENKVRNNLKWFSWFGWNAETWTPTKLYFIRMHSGFSGERNNNSNNRHSNSMEDEERKKATNQSFNTTELNIDFEHIIIAQCQRHE